VSLRGYAYFHYFIYVSSAATHAVAIIATYEPLMPPYYAMLYDYIYDITIADTFFFIMPYCLFIIFIFISLLIAFAA